MNARKPNATIGDVVVWTSQSRGYVRTKRGTILAVIPANKRPSKYDFPELHKGAGIGAARNHTSYVVIVGSKLYWPVASNLEETK